MFSVDVSFWKGDRMSASRRGFFKRIGLLFGGAFAGGARWSWGGSSAEEQPVRVVDEEALHRKHELVVVGGGIAGTTAAIAAARDGVDVALVHNRSMFGGNSSSEVKLFPENNPGHQPWIKEGGIHDEFHTEERVRNHDHYREGKMNAHWDLVLYEWVHREENLTPYLNTHMHRVFMDGARIRSIYAVQLGTEKSFEIEAPLFIDCTGDGMLAGRAGAEHGWGREARSTFNEPLAPKEADDWVMGNTLFFTAYDMGKPVPFKRPEWAAAFPKEGDLKSRGHGSHWGSWKVEGGYWWIEVGAPYHPIEDMNEARHEGVRQVLGVWDHIKNQGDHGAENYGLQFVGFWPYKRAARRIRGDHVLTQHDVQDPGSFPDAVAYGVWPMDVHVQGGILTRDRVPVMWGDHPTLGTMVYPIPLRSLYSRSVENLMMAGRPISCSYLAFSSSRVLSTGCIAGQAAGTAAAIARENDISPRQVAKKRAKECQQRILRQDGHIPGVVNEDPDDLARKAEASASSEAVMAFPEPFGTWELDRPLAQLFPVSADRIDRVELNLRSTRDEAADLRVRLREAPHVWDFRSERDLAGAKVEVPADHDGWVSVPLETKVKPGKLYYVRLDPLPGVHWKAYRDDDKEPSRLPVGSVPAELKEKRPYEEQTKAFRETYPRTDLADLPGTTDGGRWEPVTGGRCFSLRVEPKSRPYSPANVNQGTNRPDMWSNIWISSPDAGLPAWVQLRWSTPVAFDTVQLTFDTNQNTRVNLPLYRYPDCVKDYVLEAHVDGKWQELTRVEDNYMRRRVHRVGKVRSDRLRVRVLATNGAPSARVYEVRVYRQA